MLEVGKGATYSIRPPIQESQQRDTLVVAVQWGVPVDLQLRGLWKVHLVAAMVAVVQMREPHVSGWWRREWDKRRNICIIEFI